MRSHDRHHPISDKPDSMRSITRENAVRPGITPNFLSFPGVMIEAPPHLMRRDFALLKSFNASFRFLLQA
jgi:hypothetical protein